MAPSATETVKQLATDTADKLKLYPGGAAGVYKELAPVAYSKQNEEQGTDDYKAAKASLMSKA